MSTYDDGTPILGICWYCDCKYPEDEEQCPECGKYRSSDPGIDAELILDSGREG